MIENKYTEKDFEDLPRETLIKYRVQRSDGTLKVISGKFLKIQKIGMTIEVWAYWGRNSEPSWMPVQSIYYIKPQKNLVEVIDTQFGDLYV